MIHLIFLILRQNAISLGGSSYIISETLQGHHDEGTLLKYQQTAVFELSLVNSV